MRGLHASNEAVAGKEATDPRCNFCSDLPAYMRAIGNEDENTEPHILERERP